MEEIKCKVKLRELLHSNYWEEYCTKYGVNVWCMNEGLGSGDEYVEISLEEAKEWLIKK